MRVRWEGAGGEVLVRIAETPDDERRLRRTERILRLGAHPGVVALAPPVREALQGDPLTLRLARLPGPCLAGVGEESPAAVGRWAAALATTVADLHDIGCFHTAIRPEHVVFDGDGRPVLCGFGSAVAVADPAESASLARGDTAALARLILDRLGSGGDRRLGRRLEEAAAGRRRAPDARRIARLLAEHLMGDGADEVTASPWGIRGVAGRRPTWSGCGAGSLRRLGPAVAVPVAVVTVVVVAWLALVPSRRGPAAGRPAPAPTRTCRPAGCPGRLVVLDGPAGPAVLHTVSSERPVTVTGRWDCGPSRPAVLDLRSGAVWVLPGWPGPGRPVTGRFVATVPGATRLVSRPGGPGCDGLVAERPDGPVLVGVGRSGGAG